VSDVTETLHKLVNKNINVWHQSDFMRELNDSFGRGGDNKYATAIVLSIHRVTGRMVFSTAGHPPPLWYHAAERTWGWLEEGIDPQASNSSGLPLGLISGTNYRQTVVALKPKDLLVLYTDGITEAENGTGQDLGRKQLLKWARQAPVDCPRTLGQDLLQRLQRFRGNFQSDDLTLMVLQREDEPLLSALGKVARSNTVGRLLRMPRWWAWCPAFLADILNWRRSMRRKVGRKMGLVSS
jgi:serine phosphatase RsbU (regulator of sigma subunit)